MIKLDEKPDTSLEMYRGSWETLWQMADGSWHPDGIRFPCRQSCLTDAIRETVEIIAEPWAWWTFGDGHTCSSLERKTVHMQIPVGGA